MDGENHLTYLSCLKVFFFLGGRGNKRVSWCSACEKRSIYGSPTKDTICPSNVGLFMPSILDNIEFFIHWTFWENNELLGESFNKGFKDTEKTEKC